jgi:DNA-binding transcriptional ArsR family regulator
MNRTLAKLTLSQHFKILREAGLIRSERNGVEVRNTKRSVEFKETYCEMIAAILNAYGARTPIARVGKR